MNFKQMNNNKVYLTGKVVSKATFSHETFGEAFYSVDLSVPRLSDNVDIIPVTVSEKLIDEQKFTEGNTVSIKGQYRSYNKQIDGKSKLVLTVFVREVVPIVEDVNPNQIELEGYLCKKPIYRTTPFNREITDFLIAVNRAYNKSDYIPCIAWGRNSRYLKDLEIGEKISVVGRIQSRAYQKKLDNGDIDERIAYEISVSQVSLDRDDEKGFGS